MANISKRVGKTGEVSYKIQVLVTRDSEGKQITKSITWKPPEGMKPSAAEKEAQKQAVLFEEKVKSGAITVDGSMKFADYAARWMEITEMRPTTYAKRAELLAKINQAIGHIPLEKLRPEHLQQFYKNLKEDGIKTEKACAVSHDLRGRMEKAGINRRAVSNATGISMLTLTNARSGKRITQANAKSITDALSGMGVNVGDLFTYESDITTLSPVTVCGYHRVISAVLNSAKKSRIILHSVTEYMNPPKADVPEARYLDDNQARRFLLAAINFEDIRIRTALILLLSTGMRRGELCGLEWRDIDFLESKIHVRRSSQYTPKAGIYESATKTKGSVRSISVFPFVMNVLMQYKEWQSEQEAVAGDEYRNEKGRLFTAIDGSPIDPRTIRDWAERFSKKSGFPYINPHGLRHTFITLQIAAGIDIKTIQSRSGHANAITLLNVYGHAIQSAQDKAAAALGDMLLPPAQEILELPQAAQSETT